MAEPPFSPFTSRERQHVHDSADKTSDRNTRTDVRTHRQETVETKPAFKTTETIVYLATVACVLIASALVDENEDGQGFGADRAGLYVTLLTIGYLISRGFSRSGSYAKDSDPRTDRYSVARRTRVPFSRYWRRPLLTVIVNLVSR